MILINILIPLKAGSRGDQILNAKSFESQGFSIVLDEDDITTNLLLDTVHHLFFTRQTYIDTMSKSSQTESINTITKLIERTVEENTPEKIYQMEDESHSV